MPTLIAEPISAQRAFDLLEKAVAGKGRDYVYPGALEGNCANVELIDGPIDPSDYSADANEYYQDPKNWKPGCVVGHAICLAGVAPKRFVEIHDVEATVPGLVQDGAISFVDATAGYVWAIAQELQDCGNTWGEALDAAERVLKGEDYRAVFQEIAGKEPNYT